MHADMYSHFFFPESKDVFWSEHSKAVRAHMHGRAHKARHGRSSFAAQLMFQSSKSCCRTMHTSLLDSQRLGVYLDLRQHLLQSLMFAPTLSLRCVCVQGGVGAGEGLRAV